MGSTGMDDRLRGSCYTLYLRVPVLSLVESSIRLHRDRAANRGGGQDQLGRRSVHKLRRRDPLVNRRRVVVVCGIECVSSSHVVDNAALARLLTLHHLQRHRRL